MLRSLIPLLACPDCLAGLRLLEAQETPTSEIENGALGCSACESRFPIDRGIPRLMPRELLAAQKEEIEARDAQVSQYDGNAFLNIFGRFEMPKTLAALAPDQGDRLLEAGCGTGRMTVELAGHVREMASIDFSFASLLANKAKLKAAGIKHVHLAQADLCHLPFADAAFDRALSCQVLEHVPGDDARASAVRSIARVAKPGATVVISAYQHSPLMGKKEGRHDGGIPFFRFTRAEFRELLSSALHVKSVAGSLIYLFLARCERPQ